jgi:hypothetical protein
MMKSKTESIDISSDELKAAEQGAFAKVNRLLLSNLSTKITAYPSMDITDILEQNLKTYPYLRQLFCTDAQKSLFLKPDSQVIPAPPVDHHKIVMTHGDLHPRNIMVAITRDDSSVGRG